MLQIKKHGILLEKRDLGFEQEGVLNPAVWKDENTVHLFYRAVARGNYSTIGYCRLEGPLTVAERPDAPVLFPQFEYEYKGVEDPRIVRIDDLYYLTYTAYDGINALGALALSKDLRDFEKKGLIVARIDYEEFNRLAGAKGIINEKYLRYNEHRHVTADPGVNMYLWDKNVVFFPRRIQGKLHFIHRIKPDIQIVCVDELAELTTAFWQHYFLHLNRFIVLSPKYEHEVSYIGGGCPPVETPYGWLIIYHGVHDTIGGYVYCCCAALLDLENPQQVIARLPVPLFSPEEEWELRGYVNNVCFPTGTALFGDELYIYYGAADEHVACASVSLTALLHELLLNKEPNVQTTEFPGALSR